MLIYSIWDALYFLMLYQFINRSENPEHILTEALDKINELNSTKFLEIAKELDGQDPYQFLRAYTSGKLSYLLYVRRPSNK